MEYFRVAKIFSLRWWMIYLVARSHDMIQYGEINGTKKP